MQSVKDYSISADAAQGAMPARGGARPNRRWRVLARDRQRGKGRRLTFNTFAFGGIMTQLLIQSPVAIQELLISSLAQTDALAKLLIEKGLITREEFVQKISEECATYQQLLNPTRQ